MTVCPACRFESPAHMRFCGRCGQALGVVEHAEATVRRHLTVLFTDLVGSTALSARLDPEDQHAVLAAYYRCCEDIVRRFGGQVVEYLGDGLVCYFGYPLAQEDAAERAVRAALEVAVALPGLELPEIGGLHTRIGIATGPVVVDRVVDPHSGASKPRIVGEPANLAARLQSLAPSDGVVLADATRRIVGELFEYQDLGRHAVKGFEAPVQAWKVLAPSAVESRLEARIRAMPMPLIGRDREIAALDELWADARAGRGRAVLIAGEAGIGKSRLARAMMDRALGPDCRVVRYYSSPSLTNTELHPIIQGIMRGAGISADESPARALPKLRSFLAAGTPAPPPERLALIAALLRIESPELPPLALTPSRLRQRTVEALIASLHDFARERPMLMLWEDAHWADPTSLELLRLVVAEIAALPVLLLLTARPDGLPAGFDPPAVAWLKLERLDREASTIMVDRVLGGRALPGPVLAQIVANTDGVPLFIEELTRSLIDTGTVVERADRYELAHVDSGLRIPVTLMDSLEARLDRLGPAREVAQVGAVIGRRFGRDMLRLVLATDDAALDPLLARLLDAQLVFPGDADERETYTFKHALVQEAAYQTLLKGRRRSLHAQVAHMLEEYFPARCQTAPEAVARHLGAAGECERAAGYWQRAGLLALSRAALTEAVAHFEAGLEDTRRRPPSRERDLAEMELLANLGATQMNAKGFASAELEAAYSAAYRLCIEIGEDAPQMVSVLWGLLNYHLIVGDMPTAGEIAERMIRLARNTADLDLELIALTARGATRFYAGDLHGLLEHARRVRAGYDLERHRRFAVAYGYDLLIQEILFEAHVAWMLGEAERAARIVAEADAHAERLALPLMAPYLLIWGGAGLLYRRLVPPALERIERGIALADAQGFGFWSACGRTWRGVALIEAGELDRGLGVLRDGLAAYTAIGAGVGVPYFKARLAHAAAEQGGKDEALGLFREALDQVDVFAEGCWQAEILRLQALVLAGPPGPDPAAARAALAHSLRVAESQGALAWQLRTLTTTCRLRPDDGEAAARLRATLGRFREGLELPDLVDARAALRSCAGS
jgi:class 3 adenylate cyclase/predicted ATPase